MEDFEAFYAATHRTMLRTLTAVTGNAQEAQDCVQEAYVRAATSWKKVRGHDSPEAWVRRVAMNLAYDGHRRRRVRLLVHRRERPPEPSPGPTGAAVDVVRAVRMLPRVQQEVVLLHHMLDLPVESVARELGRPVNTVKTQLVRARARLAEILAVDEVMTHD